MHKAMVVIPSEVGDWRLLLRILAPIHISNNIHRLSPFMTEQSFICIILTLRNRNGPVEIRDKGAKFLCSSKLHRLNEVLLLTKQQKPIPMCLYRI